MSNPLVFISGCHKSGSSLFRSLFYGHPQTIVVPVESHSLKLIGSYTMNPYQPSIPKPFKPSLIFKNIEKHIKKYEQSKSQLSDARLLKGSASGLISRINSRDITDKSEFILRYLKALIEEFSDQELNPGKTILEKSVTNAEFTLELNSLFPKAKFIHIIRNPYSNIVALRKYNTATQKGPYLLKLMQLLRNNLYFLYKNRNILEENKLLVIRYEDLLSNPARIMREVSGFLDIEYSETLLTPKNALGDIWKGNSTTGVQFTKINKSKLFDYLEDIHPLEIQLINSHFKFLLQDYNYELLDSKGSIYKMFPQESLSRYIINRLTPRLIKYWQTKGDS